jgi:hypothetical protein
MSDNSGATGCITANVRRNPLPGILVVVRQKVRVLVRQKVLVVVRQKVRVVVRRKETHALVRGLELKRPTKRLTNVRRKPPTGILVVIRQKETRALVRGLELEGPTKMLTDVQRIAALAAKSMFHLR